MNRHIVSKISIITILTMTVLFLGSCDNCNYGGTGPQVEVTNYAFYEEPQGGEYVSTLTCTVYILAYATPGTQEGLPEDGSEELTIKWKNENGTHKTINTYYTWSLYESSETYYTTTLSAPEGMYLDKTFWVEATWKDKNGRGSMESPKAVCTVP